MTQHGAHAVGSVGSSDSLPPNKCDPGCRKGDHVPATVTSGSRWTMAARMSVPIGCCRGDVIGISGRGEIQPEAGAVVAALRPDGASHPGGQPVDDPQSEPVTVDPVVRPMEFFEQV